jgi:hypothetical protein
MKQNMEKVAVETTNSIFLCISSATICSPHLFLVVSCHEQHTDDDRSLEHVYFNRLIHTGTVLAAVTAICSAARADLQQHNWEMS